MNLYWVETDDHSDDWFLVAEDKHAAVEWFASATGFIEQEPTAMLVCAIKHPAGVEQGWPSQALLESLGAVMDLVAGVRVVTIAGSEYCEGGFARMPDPQSAEMVAKAN